MFYFFYDIIFFRLLKEKDDMRMYALIYFYKAVKSQNLETANHIANPDHFRAS